MSKLGEQIAKIKQNPAQGYLATGRTESEIEDFASEICAVLTDKTNIFNLKSDDNSIKKKDLDAFLAQSKLAQSDKLRVYVVHAADKLTATSANSLLKQLEEPGKNTIYILTTTNPAAIIPTIKSRLQLVNVSQDSTDINSLTSGLNEVEATILKSMFSDDVAKVTHYSENEESRKDLLGKVELVKKVISQDIYTKTIVLKEYWKDKEGLNDVLDLGVRMSRSALKASSSNNLKAKKWAKATDVFLNAKERLRKNVSPRLVILELVVQL